MGAPLPRPPRARVGWLAGRDARLVHRRADPGRADGRRPVDGSDRPDGAVGPSRDPGPPRDAGLPPGLDRRRLDLAGATSRRPRPAPGRVDDGPADPARGRDAGAAIRALEGTGRSGTGSSGGVPAPVDRRRAGRGPPMSSWRITPTTPSTTGTSGSTRIPRTGASPTCSGRTTRTRTSTSTSTSRGDRPMGGPGLSRSAPACQGQHCQPIALGRRSPARGVFASQRPAGHPRGRERGLRAHLGSARREIVVWASDAGTEPGAGPAEGAGGVLERHGRLAVRASARRAPRRTARCSSRSTVAAESTRSARWARIRV